VDLCCVFVHNYTRLSLDLNNPVESSLIRFMYNLTRLDLVPFLFLYRNSFAPHFVAIDDADLITILRRYPLWVSHKYVKENWGNTSIDKDVEPNRLLIIQLLEISNAGIVEKY
jgi:hypothetical protein